MIQSLMNQWLFWFTCVVFVYAVLVDFRGPHSFSVLTCVSIFGVWHKKDKDHWLSHQEMAYSLGVQLIFSWDLEKIPVSESRFFVCKVLEGAVSADTGDWALVVVLWWWLRIHCHGWNSVKCLSYCRPLEKGSSLLTQVSWKERRKSELEDTW